MVEKSQYKSLSEWRNAKPNDYHVAKNNGWIDGICTKFGWVKRETKPAGYWIKEKCIEEAKKYKTKSEWAKNSGGSYRKVIRYNKNWLDKCTKHMK
jgi:hypothetical protein